MADFSIPPPTPDPSAAWLECSFLDPPGQRLELQREELIIGRASTSDIVILDARVSRRHARLYREDRGWWIEDLNSSNGVFINNLRVNRERLQEGDEIRFGLPEPKPLSARFHDGHVQTNLVLDQLSDSASVEYTINVAEYSHSNALRQTLHVPTANPQDKSSWLQRWFGPNDDSKTGSNTATIVNEYERTTENEARHIIAWSVSLLSRIGKILQTSANLDEMLGKVLELAFESLPVTRGAVLLLETDGALVPRLTRTNQGAEQGPMRISNSIARHAIETRSSIIVTDAGDDIRFSAAASVHNLQIRAAMCAPMYHEDKVRGVFYVDRTAAGGMLNKQHLEVLTALAMFAAVGVEQYQLREDVEKEKQIRSHLARYSSPRVVDRIIAATAKDGEMIVEEREVSVLFSDLVGFTSMSESLEPAEVASLLNQLFEGFTRAIFRQEGTLDKFIGDGMMAIFGAPLQMADHADRAVLAGLQMIDFLEMFNQQRDIDQAIQMRIGINTGRAIVGDLGSPERRDYTVIGDSVNIASRLESSVARPGDVVIGPRTFELIQGRFECEPLPPIVLKGKKREVCPYRVIRVLAKPGTRSSVDTIRF